jgi:amino acid adenylation domain-containing protein
MLSEAQRAALTARVRRGKAAAAAAAAGADGAAATVAAAGRLTRRPPEMTSPPASFGQEQLWFLDRFAPGQAIYNLPCVIHLRGPLDAAALTRALACLLARHEALRTRLVAGPGSRPVQAIDPPRPPVLTPVDLSGVTPGQQPARLREFIAAESLRPFTLDGGPLLRTWLVRLGETEHALVAVVHHAVFDGWSAGVLLRDLAALYRAEVTGEPAGLADLPVQFADYAVWERDRVSGAALAELEAYWRQSMDGFETVRFPTDRPRPVIETFEGGLAERMTGRELLDGLRELSRAQGCTLYATLLAGLLALLHRYTGQDDLTVGTVSANRRKAVLEPVIGFLVNTLPIRAHVPAGLPFSELLGRVAGAAVGAFAHQDLPFGKLVETLDVPRDASRAPVFQIAMTYAERDATPVSAAGLEFLLTDLVVGTDAAKFDLTFALEARAGGLWIECSYKSGLFEAATVERLLGNFEVLLRGAVADPATPVSALPLLTGGELHDELVRWNDTAAPLPEGCVHTLFAAQAARTPAAVAAQFEGQPVRYADLDRQANQIAHRLRGLGAGPEVLVGVCMQTGLRRLAALLGIWKAGGGYVPLDPALPAERLAFMMADTGMTVVLTDDQSAGALTGAQSAAALTSEPGTGRPGTRTVVRLDAEWEGLTAGDGSGPPTVDVTSQNAAYVLYTSGSTGQPKGVVVEHRQVAAFARGMIGSWQVGPADVVLGFAALSFDVSVLDMFVPLLAGARVVLATRETLHSPPRLAALIRETRVTFACLTPSVLSLLGGEDFTSLRVLMTAGEELPAELAARWLRPGLRLVNGYGPTETTVIATSQELDAGSAAAPPIGWPMPNYHAYVLDQQLNPVPAGVAGELHIGGAGVARGYLNRPELTQQRFIPDPFRPGARLYKSGDLVRRLPDGSLAFLGRIDNQVKIRGLRIELGEIEAALATHPAVAQAVAAVLPDQSGEKQLTAYLRAEPGGAPAPAELRAHLARTLPAAMIPSQLITVATFPLNTSGKVNKKALPAPQPHPSQGTARTAPATATETMLTALYGKLLNTAQVGATDSFFDLGGNSLQAMRLVDLINSEAAVDVGVTAIFLHPTPRQLARHLDTAGARHGSGAHRASTLTELSNGEGEQPLLLVHPVGGALASYTPLAGELAGTFRVLGLEAPGLARPGATAATLAALADDYTRRIRAAQPAGPYRLAGWSMGAVAAFEIAQRLERAGDQVSMLVLLDPPFAVPESFAAGEAELAGRFVADVAHSLGWDTTGAPDPGTATAAQQLGWLAGRLPAGGTGPAGPADPAGRAARDALEAQLRRRFEVFGAHSRMLAGYRPAAPPVRAPVLLVSAAHSPNAPAAAHWPALLAGPASTLPVDSDHYAFLRPPLVADVGTAILKWHSDSGEAIGDGF